LLGPGVIDLDALQLAGELANQLVCFVWPILRALEGRADRDDRAPVPRVELHLRGVVDDVVRRRHLERELAEEGDAADRVELLLLLDLGLEGDDVDRPARGREGAHRAEHDAVLHVVEVVDLEVVELREHIVAKDDASQDRGLLRQAARPVVEALDRLRAAVTARRGNHAALESSRFNASCSCTCASIHSSRSHWPGM
jgi:hypothetical protein